MSPLRSSLGRSAASCLLLVAVDVASCSQPPAPVSRPNILVVLVDTLRYDRLGAYDHSRKLTPFLDSFAKRGTLFQYAYAQSSWTNPSVASLFTSRYQSQHHIISFGSVLQGEELTLAEILKQQGYATGAFVSNILVNKREGFGQGFDEFKNVSRPGNPDSFPRILKGRADAVNRQALQWIDSVRGDGREEPPIFLYVHYMEPHAPFDPPEEAVIKVTNGRPLPDREQVNDAMNLAVLSFPDELLRPAEDLYDAEIMSLDAELRNLFGELESRGFLLDDTIVVFVADHGEEFLEHGNVGHHHTLFEEVIRIPFFLLAPGAERDAEVADVVSLVDVAPTLLDLIGVPAPETFEGRSLTRQLGIDGGSWWSQLRSLFDGETPPAFSELIKAEDTIRHSAHEHAVVLGRDKLIAGVEGEREYYDLAADPKEQHPDADAQRGALDRALQQLSAYGNAKEAPPTKSALDPETRERMRALGYDE